MYLKEIFIHGFKSFAQPTKIIFNKGVTGIIGPNGSGKSNINDAIKWVLGETSKKTLRSMSNNDFIFEGSDSADKMDMAQVKITFDNHDRLLNIDYNEVEISRKVYRDSPENEYLINGNHVRLKDIKGMIAGTGLGKSSIANISQGSISNFIEAKPEERRLLFEEAAGVSKYKMKKTETLQNLKKTQENLKQIAAVILEKEKYLPYLKKQSDKAKRYKIFKDELDKIELSYIANKLLNNKKQLENFTNKINDIEFNINKQEKISQTETNELVRLKFEKQKIVDKIYKENTVVNEIESRLSQLEEASDTIKNISQDNVDPKKILQLCNTLSFELKSKNKLKADVQIEVDSLLKNQDSLNKTNSEQQNQLFYLNQDIIKLNTKIQNIDNQIISFTNKTPGIKTIMDQKNHLSGVHDTIENLITIDSKFNNALYESAGKILNYIIVNTLDDANKCVNYLQKNQSGVATFVPLYDIEHKTGINEQYLFALKSQPNYCGILSELITVNKQFEQIINYFFNTTIIANNTNSAVQISRFVDKKYKVVSLDGNIIFPGGIVSGGYKVSNKNNKFYYEQLLQQEKRELIKVQNESDKLTKLNDEIKEKIFIVNDKLDKKQEQLTSFTYSIPSIQEKLDLNEALYGNLTGKKFIFDDKNKSDSVKTAKLIAELKTKIEGANFNIKKLQENENNISRQITDIEIKSEEKKAFFLSNNNQLNKLKTDQNILITNQNNLVERLTERYNMTEEFCLQNHFKKIGDINEVEIRVNELNAELNSIGSVNLDSIAEYEKVNSEYEDLTKQSKDIQDSEQKLLKAIKEIDEVVIVKFTTLINDVNKFLPKIFKDLFGDGTANISYIDKDNILETGVEIQAQPPGKKITNLNLLSGGEKALVTLCVLFSILKANPTPLSILDEAEAALDVSNVVKFAKYMYNFIDKTQFIVITHRPGTMENCKIIYGATMQEKGITQILSITLEQAKQIENKKGENVFK